ncbi:SUF system FeS assembly protein, NifU family [Thermoanaerobacter mathranii subsp. mathranii str. A3]|jgi:nitrogen fixation NifU-like protein|uniref:SUF system FeS assembly protein, NifU family n=3 Tax=Thermoanaerobacter TaxID=1754 RepID=D3T6A5_THEIA|nr:MULTISPECIES: SUF system NifU family Fe-S cluster assembly protein [Thermoanaerobacter]MDK2814520.1 nitrogen fixation protein NifU [Thermoanaerobacter sp.]ADD03499.1 SUF system FeS assembly protein, NifU family [Thermoanaerobacter italicus Ab9]ADH61869.1 SUF system FeS assembly protein, NifU family [Thermoanaerobacter mathranii subsp. mathranii str. A3]MBT1278327.1 SUF system NifU family Fe-S cluster assembly protein [Thermoanaerobacter sp. CM-CNRG TB177]MDP9750246.1 nitrogen fixation NifU-
MSDLNQLYSEVIMEHYENSPHRKELKDATRKERGHNPLCGDDITLYLKMNGDIIEDASFTGHGCAISQASTSMMIDLIKGKDKKEALRLVQEFIDMIHKKDVNLDELGDAQVLQGVSDFPARVKCALLAWKTLQEIL